MKTRLIVAALLAFSLPSCSLFTDDSTPALEASQAREGIFQRQSKAFATVVNGATGISDDQKAAIIAGIDKDRADYAKLADATHAWLEELGSIDWVTVAKNGYRLYMERNQ